MRFKKLDEEETEEYKQWARDNYVVGDKISSVWHPVVVAQCDRINADHNRNQDGRIRHVVGDQMKASLLRIAKRRLENRGTQ